MISPNHALKKDFDAEGTHSNISSSLLERLEFYPSNDAFYNRLRQIALSNGSSPSPQKNGNFPKEKFLVQNIVLAPWVTDEDLPKKD
jgi:hypothetical protein